MCVCFFSPPLHCNHVNVAVLKCWGSLEVKLFFVYKITLLQADPVGKWLVNMACSSKPLQLLFRLVDPQ